MDLGSSHTWIKILGSFSTLAVYLLDTNVVSQLVKRQPNTEVVTFIKEAKAAESSLFLSVLTIGEINKGIAKLARHTGLATVTLWEYPPAVAVEEIGR
ncbi:MAG: type II toxin-antitoxin system VapC family toxin [Gammaproteobacteria bacterium]|nr:type II toxin-antitoxin system VapC family toxin [Gammaproteobacteria bacterium]